MSDSRLKNARSALSSLEYRMNLLRTQRDWGGDAAQKRNAIQELESLQHDYRMLRENVRAVEGQEAERLQSVYLQKVQTLKAGWNVLGSMSQMVEVEMDSLLKVGARSPLDTLAGLSGSWAGSLTGGGVPVTAEETLRNWLKMFADLEAVVKGAAQDYVGFVKQCVTINIPDHGLQEVQGRFEEVGNLHACARFFFDIMNTLVVPAPIGGSEAKAESGLPSGDVESLVLRTVEDQRMVSFFQTTIATGNSLASIHQAVPRIVGQLQSMREERQKRLDEGRNLLQQHYEAGMLTISVTSGYAWNVQDRRLVDAKAVFNELEGKSSAQERLQAALASPVDLLGYEGLQRVDREYAMRILQKFPDPDSYLFVPAPLLDRLPELLPESWSEFLDSFLDQLGEQKMRQVLVPANKSLSNYGMEILPVDFTAQRGSWWRIDMSRLGEVGNEGLASSVVGGLGFILKNTTFAQNRMQEARKQRIEKVRSLMEFTEESSPAQSVSGSDRLASPDFPPSEQHPGEGASAESASTAAPSRVDDSLRVSRAASEAPPRHDGPRSADPLKEALDHVVAPYAIRKSQVAAIVGEFKSNFTKTFQPPSRGLTGREEDALRRLETHLKDLSHVCAASSAHGIVWEFPQWDSERSAFVGKVSIDDPLVPPDKVRELFLTPTAWLNPFGNPRKLQVSTAICNLGKIAQRMRKDGYVVRTSPGSDGILIDFEPGEDLKALISGFRRRGYEIP